MSKAFLALPMKPSKLARFLSAMILLGVVMVSAPGCTSFLNMFPRPEKPLFLGSWIGKTDFSPDGTQMIFAVAEERNSDIYRINLDGSGLAIVTNSGGRNPQPVFSQDGSKILFSAAPDGIQGDLCLMNADGSGRVFLTTGPEDDYSPVFSPDGRKIYFLRAAVFRNYSPIARPAWHDADIYSIGVDGSNLTRITHGSFYRIGSLSIHPDGRTLAAYIFGERDAPSLWTIPIGNPDDKKPLCPDFEENKSIIPFFSEGKARCDALFDPQFSPDGKSMLFKSGHEVFIMDLATGKAKRILKANTAILNPSFSRDSRRIAFISLNSGPGFSTYHYIWIMNADGTEGRNILDGRVGFDFLTRSKPSRSVLSVPPPSRRTR